MRSSSRDGEVVPPSAEPPRDARTERRALGVLTLLAAAVVVWLAAPLGIGLLLGALLAFALHPLYASLRKHTPRRPDVAAMICVIVGVLIVVGIMALIGELLVVRGVAITRRVIQFLGPGGGSARMSIQLGRALARWGINVGFVLQKLGDAASSIAARLTELATTIVDVAFHALLMLFFMVFSMHFTLRYWTPTVRHLQVLLPFAPSQTEALFDEFRRVGKSVFLGTVLTGMAQGVLAWLGYLLVHAPEPAFFGAATAVASLIPAVGTMLVWAPLGVYLLLSDHVVGGIVLLVYGLLVIVGISDYLLRPLLVGARETTPTIVTFIAIFGGLAVFGIAGLIVGPMVMAISIAVLRLYEEQRLAAARPVD